MPKQFKPYRYEKDTSGDPFYKQVNWVFFGWSRLLSLSLLMLGVVVLLTQIVLPIYVFRTSDLVSRPVAGTVAGIATGFSEFEFNELNSSESTKVTNEGPKYYYLSIPKLNIKDAIVQTKPKDLNPDEALGHYVGTALPGETGNSFIYGHSVLPMFYNPRNYKSIFSTLGNLQTGDEISITVNNLSHIYKVESKVVVDPEKVDPLAKYKPDYLNESTVTLMTCWPAGTKSKRLMVYAVEVKE